LNAAIDISPALKVSGWMSPTELTWLAQQARSHSHIVEVGSWMGRSTTVLATHTPGMVWAIDTWEGSEELKGLLDGKPPNWLFKTFLDNTRDYRDKIIPMCMTSLEGAKALVDKSFDMIFIDASHDYASVKADIEAWRPLLAPGGLFCGHDYATGWPGVMQAVDEFFPDIVKAKNLSRLYGPSDWNSNSIWHTVLP
jgi:predicted O-methyltransferase YrrM